jgi:hypothetical protein
MDMSKRRSLATVEETLALDAQLLFCGDCRADAWFECVDDSLDPLIGDWACLTCGAAYTAAFTAVPAYPAARQPSVA